MNFYNYYHPPEPASAKVHRVEGVGTHMWLKVIRIYEAKELGIDGSISYEPEKKLSSQDIESKHKFRGTCVKDF